MAGEPLYRKSDKRGVARFDDVKPGSYTLQAQAGGYMPLRLTVEVPGAGPLSRVLLKKSEFEKTEQQAQQALQAGNFQEAIGPLGKLLESYPEDAVVLDRLARAYAELPDREKAVATAERAARLDTQFAASPAQVNRIALRNSGQAALKARDFPKAVAEFQALRAADPKDASACHGLALAYGTWDGTRKRSSYRCRHCARSRRRRPQAGSRDSAQQLRGREALMHCALLALLMSLAVHGAELSPPGRQAGIEAAARANQWEQVATLARAWASANPAEASAHYWLGIALWQLQQPVPSIQALWEAGRRGSIRPSTTRHWGGHIAALTSSSCSGERWRRPRSATRPIRNPTFRLGSTWRRLRKITLRRSCSTKKPRPSSPETAARCTRLGSAWR